MSIKPELKTRLLNVVNELALENQRRQVEKEQLLGLATLVAALPLTAVYGLKAGLPALAKSMYHLYLAKQKENMSFSTEKLRFEHSTPRLKPSALPKPRPY